MNSNESKATLVIGASENPNRYSNMAIKLLKAKGFLVEALGKRTGEVSGIPIQTESKCENFSQIDTITLYINPKIQLKYYEFIMELKPKRVIFNPGTENADLQEHLSERGIDWEEACTLVLLHSKQY
ncbi:MAG: CoA-binding protein [Bacteroidia bacterium]